jgi:soluble lytic murein transglycosylase-like protein
VPATSAVLVLVLTWNPAVAPRRDLASVQRLSAEVSRPGRHADEGQRVAASAEIASLSEAVIGQGRPGLGDRDRLAYNLLALGYSARETADVVSGRITKQTLDTARAMRLAGRGREIAANYLDSQYRRFTAPAMPTQTGAATMPSAPLMRASAVARAVTPDRPVAALPSASRAPIDAAITKYARLHAVDPGLIRAVMEAESAFATQARSPSGAIGPMQLMPATARALGVNPHIPDENIEGGVRYLSELLKMFGGVELALIAYNAGPGLARRYARGEATLYGETRDYVNQVLGRMHASR